MTGQNSVLALLAGVALAGASSAAVNGLEWRMVDNTIGNPGSDPFSGAAWSGFDRYTFDLILTGDAGQMVNGINLGDSNAPNATPYALYTNGDVFNHQFGGNTEGFPPLPFAAVPYDTFVDLGAAHNSSNISFAGGVDLDNAGAVPGVMRATWFTTTPAVMDANGELRIMRVSVGLPGGSDPFDGSWYLGGTPGVNAGVETSRLQVGLPAGALADFDIPNAFIPAPGAVAAFGMLGLAGLRRRR